MFPCLEGCVQELTGKMPSEIFEGRSMLDGSHRWLVGKDDVHEESP